MIAAVGITTGVVAWRRRAVPVTLAPVVRADLLVRVLCDGRLEPPEGARPASRTAARWRPSPSTKATGCAADSCCCALSTPISTAGSATRAEVRQLLSDTAAIASELDRDQREAAWREQLVAGDRRLVAQGAIPRATLEADELAWQQALDRAREAAARRDALRHGAGHDAGSAGAAGGAASAAGGGAGGAGGRTAAAPESGRPGAGSRLALSQATAAELERRLQALTVRAPLDGMVYGLPRAAGESVQPGQLVASVTDPDHPHVRCRVDQPDLPRVAPNQRLIVTFNGLPDRQWDGTVQRVGTGLREAGGREVGEIVGQLADPVHTLPANAAVDVQVVVAQKRGVLTVPRSALRRDVDQGGAAGSGEGGQGDSGGAGGLPGIAGAGGGPPGARRFVYVVGRHHAHRRDVTVGLIGLAEVEVLSGLNEGERVVAEGPPTMEENVRVAEAKPAH